MADIVLKNAKGEDCIYSGVTSIKLNTVGGGTVDFVQNKTNYVVGTPVEFTIPVAGWNGTTYTLNTSSYGKVSENIQIGVPTSSSIENMKAIIKCALSIPHVQNKYSNSTYSSTDIYISAVTAPPIDVTIAIWGLA